MNPDDPFRCERFNCTMKKSRCLSYQTIQAEQCRNCTQGAQIAKELKPRKKKTGVKMCIECGKNPAMTVEFTGLSSNKCRECHARNGGEKRAGAWFLEKWGVKGEARE